MCKHKQDNYKKYAANYIHTQVYFIFAKESCLVKIGSSRTPNARVMDIQKYSPEPLKLLGSIRGGRKIEHAIHRHLKKFKAHDEWFYASKEVKDFIFSALCGEKPWEG